MTREIWAVHFADSFASKWWSVQLTCSQTNKDSGHECSQGLHAAPCANDQYMKLLGIPDP